MSKQVEIHSINAMRMAAILLPLYMQWVKAGRPR